MREGLLLLIGFGIGAVLGLAVAYGRSRWLRRRRD